MASAETIAKALCGRKAGSRWAARRPAHDDREPSLSIRDDDNGKVLIRYHPGCDQGRVIAALRSRGLWDERGQRQHWIWRTDRLLLRATADRIGARVILAGAAYLDAIDAA